MKRAGSSFLPLLILVQSFSAFAVRAEEPRPGGNTRSFPAALVPDRGMIGLQAGFQGSRIVAASEYRDLLEPAPAEDRPWMGLSWGADLALRWRSGFTLSISPRRETYGLRTVEDTVSFAGNPYPHTIEARTSLIYNVWPVLAGFGWFSGRHHVQMQAGWFRAFRDDSELEWKVDGRTYPNRPRLETRSHVDGYLVGLEYGVRIGAGDLSLGLQASRSTGSLYRGLRGSTRFEAAQVRLGYSMFVWGDGSPE